MNRPAAADYGTGEPPGRDMHFKIPIVLTPQPEGGFTATSPLIPELVTEGDSLEEALANVQDAMTAVSELYRDLGRALPASVVIRS